MNFTSDGNFAIHTTSFVRARAFYQNVLGFKLVKETPEQLEFETGRFTLFVNRDDKDLAFIPALEVSSYATAKRELIAAGCEIVQEFPDHKALYFRDPLGQLMDIIEKNRRT